jgi:hypothetical protein
LRIEDPLRVPFGTRLYAFACHLLWCTLSAYYELADIAPQPFTTGYASWEDIYEALASWLLHEQSFLMKMIGNERKDIELVLSRMNELEYTFIPKWVAALQSASGSAEAKCSSVSSDVWLYCYYCSFVAKTAKEFESLFDSMSIELSEFHVRYKSYSMQFDKLVHIFKTESQLVAEREDITDVMKHEALLDLDAFTSQAGMDWKQAVLIASQN